MEVTQFLKDLTSNELEIEYRVRNLSSNQPLAGATLLAMLVEEENDKSKKPKLTHIPNSCDPSMEIESCRLKTDEIVKYFEQLGQQPSIENVIRGLGRAKHYKDRAERVVQTFGNILDVGSIHSKIRKYYNQYKKMLIDHKNAVEEARKIQEDINAIGAALDGSQINHDAANHKTQSTSNVPGKNDQFEKSPPVGNLNQSFSTKHQNNRTGTIPKTNLSLSTPCANELVLDDRIIELIAKAVSKIQNTKPGTIKNPSVSSSLKKQEQQNSPSSHCEESTQQQVPGSNNPVNSLQLNESTIKAIAEEVAKLQGNLKQMTTNPTIGNASEPNCQSLNRPKEQPPVMPFIVRDKLHNLRQRWNLVFDGGRSHNIKDFIFRIESMANVDNIDLEQLPVVIHQFLTDRALDWYWIYKRSVPNASWQQMRASVLGYFSSNETDDDVREAIINRLQKPKEPFEDFVLDVQKLNSRLETRLSERELINRLFSNMNPALRNVLLAHQAVLWSVNELKVLCQRYEVMWNNSGYDPRKFAEKTGGRGHVNAFNSSSSSVDQICQNYNESIRPVIPTNEFSQESEASSAIEALHSQQNNGKMKLICWNCKDLGHSYHDCTQDLLHKFCFGCGREGFRKPDCFNCQKKLSENLRPNVLILREGRSDFRSGTVPKQLDQNSKTQPS